MREFVVPYLYATTVEPSSTNGFTIGKEYVIIDRCNSTVTVRNDNGDLRVIIPGTQSPHIIRVTGGTLGMQGQTCVGYFTEFAE